MNTILATLHLLHITRLDTQYPRLQLLIAHQPHIVRRRAYQPSPNGQRRLRQIRSYLFRAIPPRVLLLQIQIVIDVVSEFLLPYGMSVPAVFVGYFAVQCGVCGIERLPMLRGELVRELVRLRLRIVVVVVGIGRAVFAPRVAWEAELGLAQSTPVPSFGPPAFGACSDCVGHGAGVEYPSILVMGALLFEVSLAFVVVLLGRWGICSWCSMSQAGIGCCCCCCGYLVLVYFVHIVEEGTFSHDTFLLLCCGSRSGRGGRQCFHELWNEMDAHSTGDDSEVGGGSDHGHGHGPWLYRSDAYQCCLGNRRFRRGITSRVSSYQRVIFGW
mmetsp:Transcript_8592/g.13996  ORF Transcript_8592/g.13996 Transcript_8592/m.13996 type:complete len:328 (-) Transcript_8592:12-995(-)